MDDFMGTFAGPLVPSQTRCFEGATRSFRGPGLLGPPRNSTTAGIVYRMSWCVNISLAISLTNFQNSFSRRFPTKVFAWSNKHSHFTWNALLQRPNRLAIWTASTIDCCHVPVFMILCYHLYARMALCFNFVTSPKKTQAGYVSMWEFALFEVWQIMSTMFCWSCEVVM